MEKKDFCKCKHSCVFAFDRLDSDTDSDQEDPIQLFCRIKPMRENLDATRIAIVATRLLSFFRLPENNVFTMRSTQKEIFSRVAQPLLQDLLKGLNSTLFFYGTSESGKSHTLIGDQTDPGILPRTVDTLFNTITNYQTKKYIIKADRFHGFIVQSDKVAAQIRDTEHRMTSKFKVNFNSEGKKKRFYNNDGNVVDGINSANTYAVFVSFILIYNEAIYDLLDQSNAQFMQKKVLKFNIHQRICVENRMELEVQTSAQAHELFIYGYKRKRTFLDEKGNEEWKKGHSIFTLHLVQLPKKSKQAWNAQEDLIISQLNLVDLAGMTIDDCDQVTETSEIANSVNHSVSSLRLCMQIYRNNHFRNTKVSIPYDDSKLTLFFKDYFDGDGSLRMIICVNPSIQYYEEASQAMLFANVDERYAPENFHCARVHPGTSASEMPSTSKQTTLVASEEAKPPVVMENFENIEASDAAITRLIKILNVNKHSRLASMCEMNLIESFRRRLTEMKRHNIAAKQDKRYIEKKWKKFTTQECNCDSHEEAPTPDEDKDSNKDKKSEDKKVLVFLKQRMEDHLIKDVDAHLKNETKKLNALTREEKRKVQTIKAILKNDDIESVQNGIKEKLEVLKGNQESKK